MLDVTRADLSRHTTLRLGGPAASITVATQEDEIVHSVRTQPDAVILAGGSNVVIADEGVPGPVVLVRTTGVETINPGARQSRSDQGEEVLLTAQAGQPWDDVVALAVAEGLAGIECLSGIPGSAGATPIQNVGAYGQEVAETIRTVRVFDRARDEVRDLAPDECAFGYRTSLFKHNDRFVVLAVTFGLRRAGASAPIRYAELARALDVPSGERAPLTEVRAAVRTLRASKGMVLDPTDPDTYSVGSFFTNPVLDHGRFVVLRARALAVAGTEPAGWAGGDGTTKVSAAWLIERAGFTKGYPGVAGPAGGVAVSTKHTLALTNRGTGTTAGLLALAREIRDGVLRSFDVELHPEPVLVGCEL